MKKLLITNAEYGQTLSIIRSLASKDIEVIVAGWNKFATSYYSRYVKRHYIYTHPQKDQKKFITDIIKILKKEKPDVLLPVGVGTFITVSKYKDRLKSLVKMPVTDYPQLLRAHHKFKAMKIAEETGVPYPKTFIIKDLKNIDNILKELKFPVIVKARLGSGSFGRANTKAEVMKTIKEIGEGQNSEGVIENNNPIIQEFIPGKIHDCCVLFNNGKLRAALTQKRVKTIPIDGGPGIINKTTWEPELIDYSKKLLGAIKYHGPAQVEFIRDSKTNQPKLIEVNTKFWGTSALSIKAGMNFGLLAFKLALDGDIDPVWDYKKGIYYKWFAPNGIKFLKQSDNKIEDFLDFMNCFGSKNYCDFSILDPLPDIFQVSRMVAEEILPKKIIKKIKKK
jgi:predicted ATP-grasp superfamily ATP-dependent carboligase